MPAQNQQSLVDIITFASYILEMSRFAESVPLQREEQSVMHSLIKELLKVWSSKEVEDQYQNHFLIYLDTLSKNEAELVISREIKLTLENKSHFFIINRAATKRNNTLGKLKKALEQIQGPNKTDMTQFVFLLGELRNHNFALAEAVLSFNYECLKNGRHQMQLIKGNNYLFEQLNSDNQFLKASFLNEFIAFSNSYDPFFLFHYQNTKNNVSTKPRHSSIEQLFNLSISKAYKFMKAQQEILCFLAGKVPTKQNYDKLKHFSYDIVEKFNEQSDVDSKSNIFKLNNGAYFNGKLIQEEEDDSDFLQRTKTQESPFKGIIFNTRRKKHSFTINQNKNQLPKLDFRRADVSSGYSPLSKYEHVNYRKLSEEDIINKHTFKIRRRRTSIRTNPNESPSKGYLQSLNRIIKQEEEFMKYADNSRKESIDVQSPTNGKHPELQSEQLRDHSIESPLSNKYTRQISTLKLEPIYMEKQVEVKYSKIYKNFKLKAGNLKINNVFIFLKELNIKSFYRSTFQVENWEHLLKNNQYYLHKFYVNDALEAISLCCALPDANILIKYWAPLDTCDKEMSNFLFKKYLQHIQKNTICKSIFYSLSEIPQVLNNGFVRYKEKILARSRVIPQQIDSFNYFPFLSINFSIIAVPKSIGKEEINNITISSNTVVPFNQKQFTCFNYLLIANKISTSASGFSTFGTYSPNIKNFKDVATKLIKQELSESCYNFTLNIALTNLMTLRLRHPVYSPFFVANPPLIKFIGEEIYSDQESLIASLQMVKNTKLYFGKGFSSINSMITVLKNRSKAKKQIQYCVKMFSKRMRGRLQSINLRDQYCFGDFEVIFEWMDFLKGKIDQDLSYFQLFGKENYYCILQIERQYILGFEVTTDNTFD